MHLLYPHACHMLCPYHPPWYEEPKDIWQGVQIVTALPIHVKYSPAFYWFLPLWTNIFLSTLFSNTRGLCSYLSVRDRVLQPYKTWGKIIHLYVVIFVFWASVWQDWYSAKDVCRLSPNLIFSLCLPARNFDLIVSFTNIRKIFTFSKCLSK